MDNHIIHRWYNIWYIYLSPNIFVQLESENSPFQLACIVLYIYIYHNYHIVPFELPDRFFVLWNAILPFDFLYPVTHPIYTHIFTHRFLDFLRGLHAILSRAANATIFSCVFVTGLCHLPIFHRFLLVCTFVIRLRGQNWGSGTWGTFSPFSSLLLSFLSFFIIFLSPCLYFSLIFFIHFFFLPLLLTFFSFFLVYFILLILFLFLSL